MNDGWLQVLGCSVSPHYIIAECEYCGQLKRYDMTTSFYCLSCGAPLPFTSLFKMQELSKKRSKDIGFSRCSSVLYFPHGVTSIIPLFETWDI